MKKGLLMLFVFLIGSHCAHSQKVNTLFEDGPLMGRVKQVTEVKYRYLEKSGNETADTVLKEVLNYDSLGYITGRLDFIGINMIHSNESMPYNYKKITNANGSLKEIEMYMAIKRAVYTFDEKEHMKSFTGFDKNGTAFNKVIYTWNDKDQLTNAKYLGENDSLQFERRFKYDKQGCVAEEDNLKNDEKHDYKINFTYDSFDSAGNWTKRTQSGKFKSGELIKPLASERKITYYNPN